MSRDAVDMRPQQVNPIGGFHRCGWLVQRSPQRSSRRALWTFRGSAGCRLRRAASASRPPSGTATNGGTASQPASSWWGCGARHRAAAPPLVPRPRPRGRRAVGLGGQRWPGLRC